MCSSDLEFQFDVCADCAELTNRWEFGHGCLRAANASIFGERPVRFGAAVAEELPLVANFPNHIEIDLVDE